MKEYTLQVKSKIKPSISKIERYGESFNQEVVDLLVVTEELITAYYNLLDRNLAPNVIYIPPYLFDTIDVDTDMQLVKGYDNYKIVISDNTHGYSENFIEINLK